MFMRAPFHVGLLNDYGTFAACALVMVVGLLGAQRLWRQDHELSSLVVLLAVSYTHLDVYKRQGQLTVAASTPVAVTVQEFDVVEKKGRGSGIR